MFSNTALDVFIGLVFVFLLYSLLATIIQEMIAVRFAFRAKVLEKAILRMLEDGKTTTKIPSGDRVKGLLHMFGLINVLKGKSVAPWFYAHPLIKYLGEDNYYSKPAYLDATNFSKVMIDLLKGFNQPESAIVQAINTSITGGVINKLPINISDTAADKANPAIKVLREQNSDLPDPATLALGTVKINTNTALFLRSLWQESGADISKFKQKLEQWYDDTMDRATGWYKRYTQFILFIIGFVMAVAFNVDTIAIHRILSTDKTAREQLVQMAMNNTIKYDSLTNKPYNDSLLSNTYNIVLNDANNANQVIGLGRPWSDSCKLCSSLKDSLESKSFTKKVNSFKNEIANKSSISAGDNAKALTDSVSRMSILAARCPYILAQTENVWFKYSPNQTGGWETFSGWIITALAISLGAPFWFDLLNKLVKLRGTGTQITSGDTDTSTSTKTSDSSVAQVTPVNLTVNTNTGEEAVG